MAKKMINAVSEKLAKANDSFTICMYDNGFMVEVSGKNKKDDWSTAKIVCSTLDQLLAIITEITEMERAD